MQFTKTVRNLVLLTTLTGAVVSCNPFKKKPQTSTATGWNYNDKTMGNFNVPKPKDIKAAPGLVFVQGGTFTMGAAQEDVMGDWNNIQRRITVNSFFIDKTEVSNLHYREYLYWITNVFGGAGMDSVVTEALPDTLVWRSELAYNEPMVEYYFRHPSYNYYPVVGVTWSQAKAFSVWRTQIFHSWLQSNGDLFVNDFRLPTESEWERGARGDLDNMHYPWGGPYIRNASGCFLANFKPMRGRYFEDGGFYTVKVYSYNPNGFGLYCMAGNVAEWCSTAYDESTYEFAHDMAQDFEYDAKDGEAPVRKRKVLRGGSWKDVGYYLLNATRTYEYQDTAKSYIGFRNTMTHLGRGGKDIEQENGEEIQTDIILN